jgi:hypothetical protein
MLGRVPLALEQSTAYLNGNGSLREADLARYIARLGKDIRAIETHARPGDLEGGYQSTLLATFRDCVAEVRAMEGGERALKVLRAVSIMDGARGIPLQVLLDTFGAAVDEAVFILCQVSLVRKSNDGVVLVHALVQQLSRRELCGRLDRLRSRSRRWFRRPIGGRA